MIVEFVGEPKMGKTTASIVFAKGVADKFKGRFKVIDTTPGNEAYPIFYKMLVGEVDIFAGLKNEIGNGVYVNAKTIDDVRTEANNCVLDNNYKAVIIDSSDYLLEMAVKEYLEETGHKSVYPPTEWRIVRGKVIDVFRTLMQRSDLVTVFTSPVKDEYIEVPVRTKNGVESKTVKTGNKIPAGFDKLSYIVDVRIGIGFDDRKGKRYYKVMLSRYFDTLSNPVRYYGDDISFDLFVKLMTEKMEKEVKK